MSIDMNAARDFMATHARTLDRRRFELLDGGTDPSGALAALDGYRNRDGGYGWGLEGDLRSPESQPAAALHAFEVFAETGPAPQAATLCHWLDDVTLADGGLPMALPVAITAGSGPWWAGADPTSSSLQITSVVAARAHRAAERDPAIANHPWLARATDYTLTQIEKLEESPGSYGLAFCIQFLDAVLGEAFGGRGGARAFSREELTGDGDLRLYVASATSYEVLVRGGDPRFGRGTDTRMPADPTA